MTNIQYKAVCHAAQHTMR